MTRGTDQAYKEGKTDFLNGFSVRNNPYAYDDRRLAIAWEDGWYAGRDEADWQSRWEKNARGD